MKISDQNLTIIVSKRNNMNTNYYGLDKYVQLFRNLSSELKDNTRNRATDSSDENVDVVWNYQNTT